MDDELDPQQVADAVATVPQARLRPDSAVGTHLPGHRIAGVRVRGHDVEVHVAAVWPTPVAEVAAAVRAVLAPLGAGTVDVVVDDVVLPGEDEDVEDGAPGAPAASAVPAPPVPTPPAAAAPH